MEVEEDGEFGGGEGGGGGSVEAEVEVVGGVEEDVFPDGGAVVVDWDVEAGVGGADDGAVGVDAEDASAVFDWSWIVGHGRM